MTSKENFEFSEKIELQLGDIIQILDPKNEKINEQTFIIDYIDTQKMFIINVDTLEKIKLKISDDGIIGNGTITKISILSRNKTASYAIENDLLPGKWINIHFGGDYPVIITGEITNLENDMIEVKTVDNDIIYINFDYKGIPEDLPIELIEIREPPQKQVVEEKEIEEGELEQREVEQKEIEQIQDIPNLEKDINLISTDKLQLTVPIQNVKDQLREFILKGNQIKFGYEELGPIVQYVDVSVESQRYSIETQVADLLDDLLSTIPNTQRTQQVLNNIHTIIERFKQLREQFSFFNENGNVDGALVNEATYKPLLKYFSQFKINLFWILPVVKNIKKIYNSSDTSSEFENSDVINLDISEDILKIKNIVDTYRSNNLPIEQNKYSNLYNELSPYFTPFDLINDENTEGIISEKYVGNDINVIIDNLEDMYSSIFTNNNIKTRRFVIQKYNIGLSKLDTIQASGKQSHLITTRVQMTQPDLMSLKSLITLPEPTIRFSKINLPGTSILDRANLNLIMLNYWEFLKKKTNVNNIVIDSLNDNIDFNENNFVNNIKNYILNLSNEERKQLSPNDIYIQFIKNIIPKTKTLFNLMKKYINGKLSIVEVVGYLEPFLIYTDDLTYMQYIEITRFISEKINEFNKNFIERSRIFSLLKKVNQGQSVFTNVYTIISSLNTRNEVFQGYDIDISSKNIKYTNSEILRQLTIKDYTKLYTTGISLQNIPFMYPNEYNALFEQDKKNIETNKTPTNNDCKPFIIAKHYSSLEDLENDNNKDIYFDKKYDKTNYGQLDNYEKEIVSMLPDNFIIFLTGELMKKNKLNNSEAEYLAETLINGYKKVLNGNYAILYKGYNTNTNEETDYYKRENNKWVLSNDIGKDINTDDSDILCNLQEKCISVKDNCESIKTNEAILQDKLLKDILTEFDTKYKLSKDEYEKIIKNKYDYYLSIIEILSNVDASIILKYNNKKYLLGANIDTDNIQLKPISPYTKILNLILKENDFVKKQNDIIRFVSSFTRQSITDVFGPLNEIESPYWLYCIKTNVPLLPVFRYDMAKAFITNPNEYRNYIDILISKIGKLSDDGDYWSDVNSGWMIVKIDYDFEEGYDEGFKISTRSVLEEDVGNKISSSSNIIKYTTPESNTISNIINALSVAMGINIEIQKEFIINCVVNSLRELESEKDYKIKVKEMNAKNKKMMTYKDFYNNALLYYTLGMFLIAVQTIIPSVKTRKTHPGCIRSFSGYPFEGTGDLSSLTYLACIVYDIRSSSEPWYVLKTKKSDFIRDKIKSVIDSILINIPDVTRKIEEKTEYLLLSPNEIIPKEYDLALWTNFLPPIINFKIKKLMNISDEFKRTLLNDLKNGSNNQHEKILVVYSKIILFSLALQEKIKDVVKKKSLLLHKSNNEPYLENSCCDSMDKESTIKYFITQDNSILEYNKIVTNLVNITSDILSYTQAKLFYSNVNTKNKYPTISKDFNEITIYLSFIYFCKFKSLIPIPEELLPLCGSKPENMLITANDNITEIIGKLKNDGRNYTNDTFIRLLQIVGRNNIISMNINKPIISSLVKLQLVLENIENENDEFIEGSLIKLIRSSLDTFEIATEQTTKEVRDLNNFLYKHTDSMKNEIIEFIDKHRGTDITRSSINKMKQAMNSFSKWSSEESTRNEDIKISNDLMYNAVNFYKTFISYFTTLFPNIILNKVDYTNTNIPKYLGLSLVHSNKIKNYISDYYEKLKNFYGIPEIYNILTTVQMSCANIVRLSNNTPSFSSIKYDNILLKPIFDEKTSRLLYEYYLLKVFITYIELTDDPNMIVTEVTNEQEETDLFSVDYVEERNTRLQFAVSNRSETDTILLRGNVKGLKQKISKLLLVFIEIMNNEKDVINISYEDILDRTFKLREREKDIITDRLKLLSNEERDADTILKINKLGVWSKGLQKGLTTYVKETYDEEIEFRDEMEKTERNVKKRNKNATNDNIDQYMEDYIEEQGRDEDIEREAYDMSYINDDYMDGNLDGNDAPEEDYEDYQDYDS